MDQSSESPPTAMTGPAGDTGIGRSPLLVIFTTVFIDLLGFGIIIPILPFYAQSFGAGDLQVTALFASYSLAQFIFAPLWGRISDAVGRRPIILMSLAGSAVSFTIFGLAPTLTLLFLGRIFAGTFGASVTTAFAYIADVTTPENRARGMGLVGAAFGLGFIFGPFIGGVLSSVWGYQGPAFFAAALALINLTLAWFRLPESYPREHRAPAGTRPSLMRTLSLRRLWDALHHPEVGALLLLFFLVGFAMANMEATYALLTEKIFGWGARQNGYAFGFIGIVIVLTQGALIRPLAARFGEHRLVVAGTFLLIPSLALLPFSPGLAVLLLLSGLMAFGSGINSPSLSSLISKGVSADEQGGIMGASQGLGSLARVLGPLWGGFSFQTFGPSGPYLTAGLLMTAGWIMALVLLRRHDR
jgi:DHA1 family tetracycline resistance protein-like MFS transporter